MRGCCVGVEQELSALTQVALVLLVLLLLLLGRLDLPVGKNYMVFSRKQMPGSWPPGVRRSDAFTEVHGVSDSWVSEATVTPAPPPPHCHLPCPGGGFAK